MILIKNVLSFVGYKYGLNTPSFMLFVEANNNYELSAKDRHQAVREISENLPETKELLSKVPESVIKGSTRDFKVWLFANMAHGLLLSHQLPVPTPQFKRQKINQYAVVIPTYGVEVGLVAINIAEKVANETFQSFANIKKDEQAVDFKQWLSGALGEFRQLAPLPNSVAFVIAGLKKGIPWAEHGRGLYQLGHGAKAIIFNGSFTDKTSNIGAMIARNKMVARERLMRAGLPTVKGNLVKTLEEAQPCIEKYGFPLVAKPASEDQGRGVTLKIETKAGLEKAFEKAATYKNGVIVEKHVSGDDYRLLVVQGQLLAVAKRLPAGVFGDGKQTVEQLVEQLNGDSRRGEKKSLLIKISLDEKADLLLSQQQLNSKSIPELDYFVKLRDIPNISEGGTAENIPLDNVHPDNKWLAIHAARVIGLDIAGVDLLIPDISGSWMEQDNPGYICEVNAQPGFRPHWLAEPNRDINGEVIDILFSQNQQENNLAKDYGLGRIPIVAITGTNGKSTTSLMVDVVLRTAGLNSGVCVTQGNWVGGHRVFKDNLSGYPGGVALLKDPTVEAAVIEMPRKGLQIYGTPFDYCDVAALLNIEDDHIGEDGIESIEQLVKIKMQLLPRAKGKIVINADDLLCTAHLSKLQTKTAILVSTDISNPVVERHLLDGGICYLHTEAENGEPSIIRREGNSGVPVLETKNIPATMNNQICVNQQNATFAAAIAFALGVSDKHVTEGLSTFENTEEMNPGRYNYLEGHPYTVLQDFAHNPDGFRKLANYVKTLTGYDKKIVLFKAGGMRIVEHIDSCAEALAGAFDFYICSADLKTISKNPFYEDKPDDWLSLYKGQVLEQLGVAKDNIHMSITEESDYQNIAALAGENDLVILLTGLIQAKKILSCSEIVLDKSN